MKYFLTVPGLPPDQEVVKEDYIRVERACGFISRFGPDEIATSAFSSGGIEGRVEYEPGDR